MVKIISFKFQERISSMPEKSKHSSILIRKSTSFLQTADYMILSSIGMIFSCISLLSAAIGYIHTSPSTYSLIMLSLMFSSLIVSHFQIMAALQIPGSFIINGVCLFILHSCFRVCVYYYYH